MSFVTDSAQLQDWRNRYHYRAGKIAEHKAAHDSEGVHRWWLLLNDAHQHIVFYEKRLAHEQPAHKVTWMPGVEHRPRESAGSYTAGYAPKILWHTTDGGSDATSTLDANRDWPHFEVLLNGHIMQYLPIDQAGRALAHAGGSAYPETNRANVVQTEVVGFETGHWPDAQVNAIRKLARWIEYNHGVERACHVAFHPVSGVRLGPKTWQHLTGHCGHMHVPLNDHEDPGPIDQTGVLRRVLS